jgi:hypothetical protein
METSQAVSPKEIEGYPAIYEVLETFKGIFTPDPTHTAVATDAYLRGRQDAFEEFNAQQAAETD